MSTLRGQSSLASELSVSRVDRRQINCWSASRTAIADTRLSSDSLTDLVSTIECIPQKALHDQEAAVTLHYALPPRTPHQNRGNPIPQHQKTW